MKKLLLLCLLFSSINLFSQWSYKSGGNDFDGKFKTSSVRGSGGSYPYTKPLFVINKFENNESPNIYFSDAGYSGCDSKQIYFKFDGEDNIYETYYVSSGANNDSWFISEMRGIKTYELLEKMMKHKYVSVRLKSNCGQEDYKFSLSGSSKAINYVLGENWVQKERKKEVIERELLIKRQAEKDSLRLVNLKKRRLKDSIYRAKKIARKKNIRDSILNAKRILKEKCKEYIKKFPNTAKDCYVVIEKAPLLKEMHHLNSTIELKKDILLLVDKKFKNKVFFKVIDYNDSGKVDLYVLKKYVEFIW